MNVARTLRERSIESGLSELLLKTVYLRGVRDPAGRPETALRRVDSFILYALVRDTTHAKDRDLVVYLQDTLPL